MDCACARELLINGQIVLTMAIIIIIIIIVIIIIIIIIPVNLMYQRVLLALYTSSTNCCFLRKIYSKPIVCSHAFHPNLRGRGHKWLIYINYHSSVCPIGITYHRV